MNNHIYMSKVIDIIIEIPYNSFVKYEFDEEKNKMRCDRILNTAMLYPGNYGYIPNTLAQDGDALDVLLICDYPIYPNIIVESKIIGVLIMEDEKGIDEKILAVPSNNVDGSYKNINEISDISTYNIEKIKHFFKHYKDNDDDKWSKIFDVKDSNEALKLYKRYLK